MEVCPECMTCFVYLIVTCRIVVKGEGHALAVGIPVGVEKGKIAEEEYAFLV